MNEPWASQVSVQDQRYRITATPYRPPPAAQQATQPAAPQPRPQPWMVDVPPQASGLLEGTPGAGYRIQAPAYLFGYIDELYRVPLGYTPAAPVSPSAGSAGSADLGAASTPAAAPPARTAPFASDAGKGAVFSLWA
jgi:hypothetical protein